MISFLGVRTDGQTDTVLETSYGNMSAHKKFQLKAQNKWLAVNPYMPPRNSGRHKNHLPFACKVHPQLVKKNTILNELTYNWQQAHRN